MNMYIIETKNKKRLLAVIKAKSIKDAQYKYTLIMDNKIENITITKAKVKVK